MNIFNVTLLAPLALVGLLALAVPLYLHMRHKPRAEIFRFPAIDFLLRAQRKRKRRLQIEQLLLMLFRLGIIGLLAFLFAKPFIDEKFNQLGGNGGQPLVILLDDSASMLAGPANSRFFYEAIGQIRDLLGQRPGGSPTLLIPASKPTAYLDLRTSAEIADLLPRLKPTAASRTLDEGYRLALEQVEAATWPEASLRIFSDGSLSAWGNLPNTRPNKVEVVYTSLRDQAQPLRNAGILQVSQSPGDSNAVEVGLTNGSSMPAEFQLRMTPSENRGFTVPIRVDPFSRGSHRFGLTDPLPGTVRLNISDDDFDLDNEVIFVPQQNKMVRILVVDGDSHPEPVQNESFFMANALGLDESAAYGYQLEVVTPAGLDRAKVDAANVICMLNVDVADADLLEGALTQGKGLFIAMGDLMDFERWNQFLGRYDLEMYETKTYPGPQPVEIKEFDHPFFGSLESFEWRSHLEAVGVDRLRLISVGRSNVEIPLTLADSTPLLIARDLRPGRIMIWASTMDLDWTTFPLQFGYVPFVRQIISYLAAMDAENSHAMLTVNEAADLPPESSLTPKFIPQVFANLDIEGPKPGVYTRTFDNHLQFVLVRLDPAELDFRTFGDLSDAGDSADTLAKIGFQSHTRADLAPSIQWVLFLLILVETVAAGTISMKWGAR